MGGGQSLAFIKELSKCAQGVLLVSAAEDVS